MTSRRPFGIYVILVLFLLNIASIVADLFRIQVGFPSLILPEVSGAWASLINQMVAAMLLAIALGLWLLKQWAWIATMLVTGIGLAYGLVMYWQGTPIYTGMAINVCIALYLNQGAVQRAFEHGRPAETAA